LASSLDEQLDLVSLGNQMGVGISDIVGSLNALVELNGLPADLSALITGDSSLNDFVDALDFGESVDTDAMLGAFTNPCTVLGGLGEAAQAICDDPSSPIEAALAALQSTADEIESVVGEVDAAIDGTITTTLGGIQSTVNSIDSVVDDIEDATDDIESIVRGIDRNLDAFCEMTDDLGYFLDWFLDRDINCPF
jgi:flagellin-like hook-associated protein FlgL